MEDPLLAGLERLHEVLHQPLEEARRSRCRSPGASRPLVDDEQLQVGRVAQLPPAELAEPEERHRAGRPVAELRGAVDRDGGERDRARGPASSTASARSVSASSNAPTDTAGSSRCFMSTSSISSSLSSFSRRLRSSKESRPRRGAGRSSRPKGRAVAQGAGCFHSASSGGEVLEVAPQEILPEELAAPEELRQRLAETLSRARESGQRLASPRSPSGDPGAGRTSAGRARGRAPRAGSG